MSDAYVIPQPPQAAIAVKGSDKKFPVRRIWCVGRNYVEHIREMGQDERAPPFFFAKPADAIVPDGGVVPYPPLTKDMHHEVELVVALKSGGSNIKPDKANDCIYGYGVGIDLTRRDLQIASRESQAAVGDRQGVRRLRAVRAAGAGLADRPPDQGSHRAEGQRHGEAGRRPQPDDLERAGDDLEIVGDGRACRRRHHHDRHARRRRRGRAGDKIECEVEGIGTLTVTIGPCKEIAIVEGGQVLIRPSAFIASCTFGRSRTCSCSAFMFGHCAMSIC